MHSVILDNTVLTCISNVSIDYIIVGSDGVCARVYVAYAKLLDKFFTEGGW